MPERSRHCSSELVCTRKIFVFLEMVTEESILGKAQTGDELKPGELPDRQSPFDLRAMGRRFSAAHLPLGKAAFAMPL